MKKLIILTLIIIIFIFGGCGKSSKIGLYEFNNQLNKISKTNFLAENYMMTQNKDGEKFLSLNIIDGIISLFPQNDKTIKGVSLLFTNKSECENNIKLFRNLCCVLTGNDENTMDNILNDCEINSDTIDFSNKNFVMTIENYKYTVVSNEYSVTLFCERV